MPLLYDFAYFQLRKNPISGEALISVLSDLQKAADLSLEMLDLGVSLLCNHIPVNTKHLYSIYTMLAQRRRRCADIV